MTARARTSILALIAVLIAAVAYFAFSRNSATPAADLSTAAVAAPTAIPTTVVETDTLQLAKTYIFENTTARKVIVSQDRLPKAGFLVWRTSDKSGSEVWIGSGKVDGKGVSFLKTHQSVEIFVTQSAATASEQESKWTNESLKIAKDDDSYVVRYSIDGVKKAYGSDEVDAKK